ncbi:MAG: hypothetical protein JWP75_3316 [Frondihabitans sp.]|nr:hypothetical protein [Frondihabitans sp.]
MDPVHETFYFTQAVPIPAGHRVTVTEYAAERRDRRGRSLGVKQAPAVVDHDTGVLYAEYWQLLATVPSNTLSRDIDAYSPRPLDDLHTVRVVEGRVVSATVVSESLFMGGPVRSVVVIESDDPEPGVRAPRVSA